jgi:hypothetical protein
VTLPFTESKEAWSIWLAGFPFPGISFSSFSVALAFLGCGLTFMIALNGRVAGFLFPIGFCSCKRVQDIYNPL